MLNIQFIRENKELVALAAKKKYIQFDVEELIGVDDARRELLLIVEKKRAEHNRKSEEVARAKDEVRRKFLIEEMRALKSGLEEEEKKLKEIMLQWQALMLAVPNIPDMSVPEGEDESHNQEVRKGGEKPQFNFPPKNHMEILDGVGGADFVRGGEVAGFRGYFLTGDGALLSFALWQFALAHFVGKGDFVPMLVPSLVRKPSLLGTGYLPQGEEDLYKTQDGDYLAGTAEVAAMSYFADSLIRKEEFPKKILAFSSCFRREAGSYGKQTKGLFRVHEFYKLEQVVLCEADHELSVRFHEELTKNAEELIAALHLPYRVTVNCGGDLGLGQVKKYDIECWIPSEKRYGETHSSSYFHDFQTRRLNIRYKDADGKTRFAHSINNTALATPRILITIVENNQLSDGSIRVPEVLQKYLGKSVIGVRQKAK